uniref:LEM domain-containing protein n=1 Tax=Onchocerca volvulus TaxID=6282 RepID=A0A8R1TZT9_ONCVO
MALKCVFVPISKCNSLLNVGAMGSLGGKMVDIDKLTNEEIRDQLMIRGCDPGPVVGSTRSVYANKLRRLLEGKSESVVQPESVVSSAARADGLKSPAKRGDVSPQKSRSPRRATRSSAQEITRPSKVQNTPITSKTSRVSPKAADISPAISHISDSKQPSVKPRVVQPSIPISPRPHVDFGFETRADVNTVPEFYHSPLKASVTSESTPLNVTSDSVKIPKSFGTMPEVYRTTPTTRFTSLRDNWGNQKVSDGSDDDLRGEESSRILSPSWKEDHTYSVRYDSEQRSMAQRLGENSATHYSPAPRYNSGVMFENSYNRCGSRRNDLMDKEKTSRNYGKIGFILLFVIITVIFIFFVVQNYAELEVGEANKEEF